MKKELKMKAYVFLKDLHLSFKKIINQLIDLYIFCYNFYRYLKDIHKNIVV